MRILYAYILLLTLFACTPPQDDCKNKCGKAVNIPDANLKRTLLEHGKSIKNIENLPIGLIDTNNDGCICEDEAKAYDGVIDVSSQEIKDMTGIEAFENITYLYCNTNEITSIDVSNNKKLIRFFIHTNLITSLDVSALKELDYISASFNPNLESLDFSQNPVISTIWCRGNENLKSLNVANGANEYIYTLNTTNNPALECVKVDPNFVPTYWSKDEHTKWGDCVVK